MTAPVSASRDGDPRTLANRPNNEYLHACRVRPAQGRCRTNGIAARRSGPLTRGGLEARSRSSRYREFLSTGDVVPPVKDQEGFFSEGESEANGLVRLWGDNRVDAVS